MITTQAKTGFTRIIRLLPVLLLSALLGTVHVMADNNQFTSSFLATSGNLLNSQWKLVSDQVMGGVSNGRVEHDRVLDRDCLRLRGTVTTENNGGFIQIALPLAPSDIENAASYDGLLLSVSGNREQYNVHLRTADLWLPWQSYRVSFHANPGWQQIVLPFEDFAAYKTRRKLDLNQLRRIGLVAIGRDFDADLCVSELRFYRD